MEADWEVEIGPETPVIDALWAGFVDLRCAPERIGEIEETRRLPALADALMRLNRTETMWTAKCDLWTLAEWDPDEMDATMGETAHAVACYVDLLPQDGSVLSTLESAEQWARLVTAGLRSVMCRRCRMDLVIRTAFVRDLRGFGITAYVAGCGEDSDQSMNALGAALKVFAQVACDSTIASSPEGMEAGLQQNQSKVQ
jgi:hypothetical protein